MSESFVRCTVLLVSRWHLKCLENPIRKHTVLRRKGLHLSPMLREDSFARKALSVGSLTLAAAQGLYKAAGGYAKRSRQQMLAQDKVNSVEAQRGNHRLNSVPVRTPLRPPAENPGTGRVVFDPPKSGMVIVDTTPRDLSPYFRIAKKKLGKPFGVSGQMGTMRNPKNRARKGAKAKVMRRGPKFKSIGQSTFVDRSATRIRQGGSTPYHPLLGKKGVVMHGSQPLATVSWLTGTSTVLTNLTPASVLNTNRILLSPDSFNGPLAAHANLYDHFVFRQIVFEYVSTCAISQPGALVMGLRDDPLHSEYAASFSTVRQLENSTTFPMRESKARIVYDYRGTQLFVCKEALSTSADVRQSAQGEIIVYPDSVATATTPLGYINVSYTIEFYCPGGSHGIVSLSSDRKLRPPNPPGECVTLPPSYSTLGEATTVHSDTLADLLQRVKDMSDCVDYKTPAR